MLLLFYLFYCYSRNCSQSQGQRLKAETCICYKVQALPAVAIMAGCLGTSVVPGKEREVNNMDWALRWALGLIGCFGMKKGSRHERAEIESTE